MMSSKQVFYTISSIILVVVVAITPSYHIKAQEANEENDPLTILTNINEFVTKINNRIKCRKLYRRI